MAIDTHVRLMEVGVAASFAELHEEVCSELGLPSSQPLWIRDAEDALITLGQASKEKLPPCGCHAFFDIIVAAPS